MSFDFQYFFQGACKQECTRCTNCGTGCLVTLKKNHYYANSTGFRLRKVSNYGSPEVPEYEVDWKLPYTKKHEISNKLRLQTMGGDFDVYKLIDELTSEFSS